VAVLRQTPRGHGSDVAHSENTNLHRALLFEDLISLE
jgi:hypothetical protein